MMMYYMEKRDKTDIDALIKFCLAKKIENAQVFKLLDKGIFEPVR